MLGTDGVEIYKSPYGFEIHQHAAYDPEEEKVIYERILEELHKRRTHYNIKCSIKPVKLSHFEQLYSCAIKTYKTEINKDAEIEWEMNKDRLLNIYENAKTDKDKIAAVKELNHMAEFSQINKKVDGQEDNKFMINFNI